MVVELANVTGPTVDLALPVWRPGRYVLIEPATTVSQVRADNPDTGAPLVIQKTDKSTWRVTTDGARSVRVTYRLYANSLNDRTRHIDDTHAFLSPASTFMYDPERRHQPLRVDIETPHPWRTATGLRAISPSSFAAPDYDTLVDSPLEIGVHDSHTFDVGGKTHEIVVWHAGAAVTPPAKYDAERMKRDFRAIVQSQAAIFGDMPYDRYVFLVHAGPGLSGGTEHLNSTIMQTSRAALEASLDNSGPYKRFLGLVSHEMFHTWNVKQFRPADLKPYDYAQENYTRLLWLVEGATSYYDDVCLVRAGLMAPGDFLNVVRDTIEGQANLASWDNQSVEDSSFDAWVKFNKAWPDSVNTTVSFYSKGALVSMLLDFEIRRVTANAASLDTVMRRLYQRFPHDGPGYTTKDVLDAVREATSTDFTGFFNDYIAGTARPDFAPFLAAVGLECTSEPRTDTPYLGLNLTEKEGRTLVASTLINSPAYAAGLMADDEVLALDGRRLKSADLKDRLHARAVGDRLTFTVFRRDELRTLEVTLAADPTRTYHVHKMDHPSDEQKRTYESWLGTKWDE
jgi:predicted metalloprotease with PDZ domain